MRLCSIVGARPNFIKLAPIAKEIAMRDLENIIIHTGQHFDVKMSDSFFKELHIPAPNYNLNIHSISNNAQIGNMIINIEPILIKEKPDAVIVFGDTNSSLSGAICASKLNIPIFHIESGCRSNDMTMPEEQNRIMIDHISTKLFASTQICRDNLFSECINRGVYYHGDVIVDVLNDISYDNSKEEYVFVTIHRPINADNLQKMTDILDALNAFGTKIVFPVHPRTYKTIEKIRSKYQNIEFIDPVNYNTSVNYIKNAIMVVTDSGGIQKESYILKTPCITLRDTTEWEETLYLGWNTLVKYISKESVLNAMINLKKPSAHINIFGDVGVSNKIVGSMVIS